MVWHLNHTLGRKCILITLWDGNAYHHSLLSTHRDGLWFILFQKTGCLLPADGTDDHLVQPKGLSNHQVPIVDPTPNPLASMFIPSVIETVVQQEEADDFEGDEEDHEGYHSVFFLFKNME